MLVKHTIGRAVLAGVIGVSLSATALFSPQPASSAPSATGTTPLTQQGVHVIGDSITAGVHAGVLRADRRPAGWTVDAQAGRRVLALDREYIAPTTDHLRRTGHIFRPPRARVATVVLALGTNATDEVLTDAQARALYVAGIRRIRSTNIWKAGPKRVVLVTPWKSPSITADAIDPVTGLGYPASKLYDRTVPLRRAVLHIARMSAHVCVMDWASYVEQHPARLHDGVHPDLLGREVWARMLKRTINACTS